MKPRLQSVATLAFFKKYLKMRDKRARRFVILINNAVEGKMKKKNKTAVIVVSFVVGYVFMSVFVIGGIVFLWFIPDIFHYDRYRGEYPHLYTVAVNSVLTDGHINTPHSYASAEIYKLDEDEYGRELFVYFGSTLGHVGGTSSAIICQAHDEEYAYWYDNINYVLSPYGSYTEEFENGVINDPQKGIPSDWIEELKEKNDWGKEIDSSRLSSARIVVDPQDRQGNEIKAKNFYNSMFLEGEDEYYGYRFSRIIACDKDGRALYEIDGIKTEYTIIAIMSPEGEFSEDCWFLYKGSTDYAEDLKRIKEAAGWNMKAE